MMRAYTWKDAVELGLNPQEYNFAKEEMNTEATLHFKVWGKKWDLQCYFKNIRTGEQFILSAFCGSTTRYTPHDKGIDFSEPGIENGLYQIIITPNAKGKIIWESAKILILPGHKEGTEDKATDSFEG